MDAFVPITLAEAKTTDPHEWPSPAIGDGGQQLRSVRRCIEHSAEMRGLFEGDRLLWPTVIVWCIGDMAPADVDFVSTRQYFNLSYMFVYV